MKRFCLFVNPEKPDAADTAEFVRSLLLKRGAEKVSVTEQLPAEDGFCPDCVITFGGDGTMIRAARQLAGSRIPIAGVNMGHLGYLTTVSGEEEISRLLGALMDNRYEIEERMMLSGTVIRKDTGDSGAAVREIALNEAVVSRKTSAGPVLFRVLVNGAFLNEYKADGIIISTPTGSTAYNLSAGGPIVEPAARMTVLTPICPHTLYRSSIVLKAEDVVEVLIPETETGIQQVDFDGAGSHELLPGDCVRIAESELTTPLIRLRGGTFFAQLRSKMSAL